MATFLLGSGISIPAGMPGVAEITERALDGSEVVRFTDTTYGRTADARLQELYRPAAEEAITFVGLLKAFADDYFQCVLNREEANYEDLANTAKQIADAIDGEYENPALAPLLATLAKETLAPHWHLEPTSPGSPHLPIPRFAGLL
jgi:hypothetical protein